MAQLSSGRLDVSTLKAGESDVSTFMLENELIFVQSSAEIIRVFEKSLPQICHKIRFFPRIVFTAFQPDMIIIRNAMVSPTGLYHSALACYGWVDAVGLEETVALFSEVIFQLLGFFDYGEASKKF